MNKYVIMSSCHHDGVSSAPCLSIYTCKVFMERNDDFQFDCIPDCIFEGFEGKGLIKFISATNLASFLNEAKKYIKSCQEQCNPLTYFTYWINDLSS